MLTKKSFKVLSLSENVKVLDLIKKEKQPYAEVATVYGKNKSSICVIVKNEGEIHASFAVVPQTIVVFHSLLLLIS